MACFIGRAISLGFGGAPVDWVLASFAGTFLIAVNVVFVKRLLMVHLPGVSGYLGLVGVIWITIGALILLATPWQAGTSGIAVGWTVASGLCHGVGLLLMVTALRRLEVSRVNAAFHTYPVFVAIMATNVLGERLSVLHWIAIILVVVGGGLVMVGQKQVAVKSGNRVAILYVFLASAGMALGMLTSKVALNEMEFWNVFGLRSVCFGAVFLLLGLTPQGLRQMKVILGNRAVFLRVLFAEAMIGPVGLTCQLLALSLGSAALVTTLLSTQPVFVLLISALLSTRYWNVMEEPLTKEALGLKGVSIAMVVGGVAVLTLA
jgi:drug/metabolite transporter (DMT)-like permease